MNYLNLCVLLVPEITLTCLIFFILGLDLFFMRKQSVAIRFQVLGLVTAVGITLTLLWVLLEQLLPHMNQSLLGGMLVLSPLTVLAKIILLIIALITVVITMDEGFTDHVGEFFAVLIFGLLGMIFMVMSEELIMIFVAVELNSISLYILTAFRKHSIQSQEASMKYFVFGSLASAFMYFGLTYIYGIAQVTNLSGIADYLTTLPKLMISADHILLIVGFILAMVGFGFKIAVAPFHLWAPDTYEGAPTPATAFIATGSKFASFLVLTKVLFIGFLPMEGSSLLNTWEPGWSPLLAAVCVASMTLGNLAAMQQKNIKRLLAYSSIAHSGYLIFGLIAASHLGAVALIYYLVVYAFTNLGAFGFVAIVATRTGGEEFDDFSGLSQRAPFLSLLMCLFILSLASIPPLGGFFGKFYLFLSAIGRDTEHYGLWWLVLLGLVNTMLSLYYYLKILKQMYIVKPVDETRIHTPIYLNAALMFCALVVVIAGVFPSSLLGIVSRSISFFAV